MKINFWLTFSGTARQAIDFYKSVFETDNVEIKRFRDLPPDPNQLIPEDAKDLIFHAMMRIGNDTLNFSDAFPGMTINETTSDLISVSIENISVEKAREIYGKLKEGGKMDVPMEKTFWSPAFGMVIDKFGIRWLITANEK